MMRNLPISLRYIPGHGAETIETLSEKAMQDHLASNDPNVKALGKLEKQLLDLHFPERGVQREEDRRCAS